MVSFIEPLYKSKDLIKFGWAKESGAMFYNIYVGISANSLSLVNSNVPNIASNQPIGLGKVVSDVLIEDVRAVLSLPSTVDFSNKLLFFTITYIDIDSVESPIGDSIVVEVPPVGINTKYMKDDPTTNRHGYVFSESLQRWVKMAGSSQGAVIIDTSDYYKSNMVTEYTYDGTDLATMKTYPSDATNPGSPAKLTTYTFSSSQLVKTEVTDSTV